MRQEKRGVVQEFAEERKQTNPKCLQPEPEDSAEAKLAEFSGQIAHASFEPAASRNASKWLADGTLSESLSIL